LIEVGLTKQVTIAVEAGIAETNIFSINRSNIFLASFENFQKNPFGGKLKLLLCVVTELIISRFYHIHSILA
jgi:hypothetical protein